MLNLRFRKDQHGTHIQVCGDGHEEQSRCIHSPGININNSARVLKLTARLDSRTVLEYVVHIVVRDGLTPCGAKSSEPKM